MASFWHLKSEHMWPKIALWASHVGTLATCAAPRWPLLCSNNSNDLYTIRMLDHFGPLSWGRRSLQATSLHSHEVDCHFKLSLCLFYRQILQTLVFLWKNGRYPEVPLEGRGLTVSQKPPCGHLLCSNNSSNPYTFRILDHFGPLLCAPMPCIAISMLTSC